MTPKNDLKPYKVKYIHICVTSIYETQISLHFALLPAVFETGTLNDPKMTALKTLRQMYAIYIYIYVLLVSLSLKFHPISLYDQLFSR